MSVWTASLTGRALGSAWRWLGEAWKASLVGRIAGGAGRAAVAAVSGSRLLSLRGAELRPLPTAATQRPGAGVLVGLLARLYVAVATGVGEGRIGRGLRRAASSWGVSCLSDGSWLRVLGACLVVGGAVSMGKSASWVEATAFGLLAAAGLVAAAAPSLLVSGARSSLAARLAMAVGMVAPDSVRAAADMVAEGTGARGRTARSHALVWAAALAAAVIGGLSAAAGSDVFVLLLAVAFMATLAVVVLYRGELLLLVLAGFPWVDWLVRNLLGAGLGGYWDEGLLACGLVVAAFSALVLRRYELRSVPAALPMLVAFVLSLGSVAINNVPPDVAQFALRVTFQPFLFYFLGVWLPKDRRWIRATVVLFLAASLLLALHGIYQYATNAPMPASWIDTHEDIGTRAYSIVNNPNGLGAFLLLGSLLAASLTLSARSRLRRLIGAGITVVLLIGIAVTFSRGAYIGLMAGFVALVLLAYRRWIGRLLLAAVVGALLVPRRFWDRLLFGFSSYYLQLSATNGRLYVWRIALQRMVDHPWWGVGLGTLGGTSAYLAGYGRLWIDSHYLQLGAEGGVLLLLAFLWVLVRVGKGIVVSAHAARDPMLRGVAAGVFGGFVAVCVAGLTTSVWETLVVGTGFWFLAGVASSLPGEGQHEPELESARRLSDEPPLGVLSASSPPTPPYRQTERAS